MKNKLSKINVHHIGGRDGEIGEFPINKVFIDDIMFHIYDSDENCMPQIDVLSKARGINFRLHPFVVDEKEGMSEFRLNHCPCTSSLLPPKKFKGQQYSTSPLMGDYLYKDAFRPVSTLKVQSVTLDKLAQRESFSVDFLSIDAQGGELRIINGANNQLIENTVGILCEVEMHHLYENQPLFGDIHENLRKRGFNFFRTTPSEARVNFFRAGIGFRGDGMLMSADALFLRDPDRLESDSKNPCEALLKLAFISLSFGYVEYSLDCLKRVFENNSYKRFKNLKEFRYFELLQKVWSLFKETPFIPQPSFNDLFTVDEAMQRFEPNNPHAWTTFSRERALKSYFAGVDRLAFQRHIKELLMPNDSKFESVLREYHMNTVADSVKDRRLKQASMTVEVLQLNKDLK